MPNRYQKCVFGGPSPKQSSVCDAYWNSKVLRKLRNAARDVLHGKDSVCAEVVLLLLACFPPAVARFVVAVIIASAQCKAGRHFAHVFEKTDVVMPPGTHLDSPTPVSSELGVLGVFTSLDHPFPRTIGLGVSSPLGVSVFHFTHSIGRSMLCLVAGAQRQLALATILEPFTHKTTAIS